MKSSNRLILTMAAAQPPLNRPLCIVTAGRRGAESAALNWARAQNARGAANAASENCVSMGAAPAQHNGPGVLRPTNATVVFTLGPIMDSESQYAALRALSQAEPVLHVARHRNTQPALLLASFLERCGVSVLHVSGSAESTEPGIESFVTSVFNDLLASCK